MADVQPVHFREIQRFWSNTFLKILLLILSGIAWYGFISQILFKIPFGSNPSSDTDVIIIFLVIGLGFPLFFYNLKLITEVRNDGVYYKFSLLHFSFRCIAFSSIKTYRVRKYKPLREYGGWGIRYGRKGKAYNVYGCMGIEFELTDNKWILIGTQKPNEFVKAIDSVIH